MEIVQYSMGFLDALIDDSRRSVTYRRECEKLELAVAKHRPQLGRLAKELDERKRNGQVLAALDEWCAAMTDLLVKANETVHECHSGSRLYNVIRSGKLAKRIQEIMMLIEERVKQAAIFETILATYSTPPLQHGHSFMQTTFSVAPPQNGANLPQLHTMHSLHGWDPYGHQHSPSKPSTTLAINHYVCSIESRRLSLGIQNSMVEVRSRAVICSTQSDYLITKIQQQSSRILNVLRNPNLTLWEEILINGNAITVYNILEIFTCNMAAAEDLLYLCAKEDWKLAALSVFLPASCVPCHSRFALLARNLDWTYYMLLTLLEVDATDHIYTSIGEALTDAGNQDRSNVLLKPEGGPSKGSVHQEVYGSLLRKRFQGDASPSAPGSVPDWSWIPGKIEYIYSENVASGNFKSVLKCQWLGLDVAIAVFKGEYAKNDLEAEAGILASVQHPNVVNLFGCAYDDKKQEGFLVTELMDQDLRQLIRERVKSRRGIRMPFSECVARDIILQIVEAMIHVHKCRVLHRDLKPANCLVSAKKRIGEEEGAETYYVVKVIDFGASKVRGADASTCHTRKQGTTAYMAPELHAKAEECAYKWPADVYSFGMTMYEIFTGKSPFEGVYKGEELARSACAGDRPWDLIDSPRLDVIPVEWKNLMETCCHHDPTRRPTFAWIRLEIMSGLPHFPPLGYRLASDLNSMDVWLRTVKMPSEIMEEFLAGGIFSEDCSSSDLIVGWNRVRENSF